jgi:small GTP-binding protein
LKILPEKRIPIAILGLENAGKTTLSVRLKTGNFEQTIPTPGLDVEVVEIKGGLFQLFDLGGHSHFRNLFWENYVQLSQGLIFIIDSNDLGKLDEVVEWLWKCLEWNISAPLLILANKSDLHHIELKELIDKIRMAELPIQNPNRSFRIFEVSIKDWTNLEGAMSWFSSKVAQVVGERQIRLVGLYLYLPTGIPIVSYLFSDESSPDLDVDLIPSFLNALDSFASGVIGINEGLQSINTKDHYILMVKREGVLCAVITDRDSDVGATRVVAESILTYVETYFSEKLSLFQKDGKLRFPKDFIIDYLIEEFKENIIIGYPDKTQSSD